MALFDTTWYLNYGNGSSTGYYAVTQWATGASIAAGALRRQLATPAVGNERVFIAIVGGTTHASTEPTWTVTRGAKTTDNTVTWQECTGASAVNGDVTNTPASSTVRSQAITLGAIIKNNGATHYFICSTAGTAGAGEPTFDTTTGNTTTDNTATWTCIGAVGAFTGGQAPHARLANVLANTWSAAGNKIFVHSAHAETQATNITLTGQSTVVSPNFLYCHDGSAYPPTSATLTTGATVTCTSTAALIIQPKALYVHGVTFAAGSGHMGLGYSNGSWLSFNSCSLQTVGGSILVGTTAASCQVELNNTTVKFSATSSFIRPMTNNIIWRNTGQILAAGSAVPDNLFRMDSTAVLCSGNVMVEGCDLSQLTSGKTIVDGANTIAGFCVLKDCKLDASVTVAENPASPAGLNVDVVRCASSAGNHITSRYRYSGTQTTETTIVRTGGASDGTTPVAAKIVTTANCRWEMPFEMTPIAIWNDTVGSAITVTVEGIWGEGSVPNNDDIWMDVEYLGSASSPLGSFQSGTKSNSFASNAALASSSASWGGSTTKFKMTATFTPQQKGLIYVYVKAGKTSATFYVDPKIALS